MVKKLNLLLILGFFLILSISFTSAVCTINFTQETNYSQGGTATARASCDDVLEKNNAYTLSFYNSTGYILHTETGDTPKNEGEFFFGSYDIPVDYIANYGTILNVNLTGTNLEGNDTAFVSSALATELLISSISVSENLFLGKTGAVDFQITTSTNKKVSGADCTLEMYDLTGSPVSKIAGGTSSGGLSLISALISSEFLEEGKSYQGKIYCYCGLENTSKGCSDEDGLALSPKYGSATFPFTLKTWLEVNTVVDKNSYVGRETMFVCANVTNPDYSSRIPLQIYHQVRCSAGVDNDNDTDRVLLYSDDDKPDVRGISFNSTQMQCKNFIIEEKDFLQGLSSECYASTEVWVINEQREKIFGYTTTSPVFNITMTDVQVDADWEFDYVNHIATSRINLSQAKYGTINAVGLKNMDVRINKDYIESIRAEDQYFRYPQKLTSFTALNLIKNLTAVSCDGTPIESQLEVNDDGNTEFEVRDVNFSDSPCVDVVMTFHDFDERDSTALEDIANKTGTFHFDIECDESAHPSNSLDCLITAYVEESQTMEKEVEIVCSIDGDGTSEISFLQMITRDVFQVEKSFFVPANFTQDSQHTVECQMNYFNFGSRSDPAQDTFTVNIGFGANIIEPTKDIIEDIVDFFLPEEAEENLSKNQKMGLFFILILMIAFIMLLCLLMIKRRKKK